MGLQKSYGLGKYAIGLAAGFGLAALGLTQTGGSFTGTLDSYSRFSYGGNDCNILDARADLKGADGAVRRFDATEWALKSCAGAGVPDFEQGAEYKAVYSEFLFNKLLGLYPPQVKMVSRTAAPKAAL